VKSSHLHFHLPDPIAVLDLAMADGATVRVRRHGNPDGLRLILSHGNGFAIDAYFPFWRLFTGDFEVFVYDQRNHGWNPRSKKSGHTLQQMADDLEVVLRAIESRFGRRKTVGAVHSLSTTVSLLHSMKYGFQWNELILFDPPLAPPPGHPLHEKARAFEFALSEWARNRREKFASADELAGYFKGTRRMGLWVPGAADLMARSITRSARDNGVELCCPGDFEADIYLQNSDSPAWRGISAIASNLFIVSSDYEALNPDPPGLVSRALQQEFGVAVVPVRNSGHLLQIEQPGPVGKIVRDHLRVRGFDVAAGD
jgi:pimeloyl-ACP methyl ester carboxylesterase